MSWAAVALGLCLGTFGCTKDNETRQSTPAFQAEVPIGPQEPLSAERGRAATPPTREQKLCEALGGSAKLSLVPGENNTVVMRIQPAEGLRAEALGAARELERAMHWPAEYAAQRKGPDDNGCSVVELGREVAMAEVREVSGSDGNVSYELHLAPWPGRADLLRGRARIFIEEFQ